MAKYEQGSQGTSKGTGTTSPAGQAPQPVQGSKNTPKGASDVPNNKDAIFISLNGGTVMLTQDGRFRGQPQPGKVMISSQKVSRVDDEGKVKATWLPLSYSDTVRLFQALKDNKEFIMTQVDKERAAMTSLNMDN